MKRYLLIFITAFLCVAQMMAAEIPSELLRKWVTLKTENGWYFYAKEEEEGGQIKLGQTQIAPKSGDDEEARQDPNHYSYYCWYIDGDATEGYTFRCLHYEYGEKKYITNPSTLATRDNEVILTNEGSKYLYTSNHQLQLVVNTDLYLAFYSKNFQTIRLHNSADYIGSKMIIGDVKDWSIAAVVYGTETEDGEGHPQGYYLASGGIISNSIHYTHGSSLRLADVSNLSIIPIDGYQHSTIKIDNENHYIVAYYIGNESHITYKNAPQPKADQNAITGEDNTIWSLDAQNYITNESGNYTNVPAGKAWQMEMVVQNTKTSGDDPSFNKWGSCILASTGDPLNTYYWGNFQIYQHSPTHSSPNTLNFKSNKGDGNDHIIAQGESVSNRSYKVIVRYNGDNIYVIRTILLNNDLTETDKVYNNVWVAARQQQAISLMSSAIPTGINLNSLRISIAEESNLLEGVDYAIQNIVGKQYLTGGDNSGTNWYSAYAGDAAKFQIEWTKSQDLTYGEDGGLHHSFYIKIVDSNKYIGAGNTIVNDKANAQAFIYATNNTIAPITAKNTLGTAWTIGGNNTWAFDFFATFYVEVAGNNSGGLKYQKSGSSQTATNGQYIELPSGVAVNQLANSSQKGYMAEVTKADIRLKVQYNALDNTFYNIAQNGGAQVLYYWYKSANKLVTYSTTNSQSGVDTEWGEKGNCAEYTITKATEIPVKINKVNTDNKYYGSIYCPNNLSLPTGVKAYRLNEVTNEGKYILKPLEGDVLPAGIPAILISEVNLGSDPSGNWNITPTLQASLGETNLLNGTYVNIDNPGKNQGANSTIYVLGNKSGIGFYPYTGSYIPAFKAYHELQVPAQSSPAHFFFVLEDEDAPTDAQVITENDNDTTAKIHDLIGRRVSMMQKGHIYIVNGKKMHVK